MSELAVQRPRWYQSYTKTIVSSHPRNAHLSSDSRPAQPDSDMADWQATDGGALNGSLHTEGNSLNISDGGPESNNEAGKLSIIPGDWNNNDDRAQFGSESSTSNRLFYGGMSPTVRHSQAALAFLQATEPEYAASIPLTRVTAETRQSPNKKAFWASFSVDEQYQTHRVSSNVKDESTTPAIGRPRGLLARTVSSVGPGGDSCCKSCGGKMYEMEKVKAEHALYHKHCFRCARCQRILSISSYISVDGKPYCKAHARVHQSALTDVPDVIPEYIATETNVSLEKRKNGLLIANHDNVEDVNGFESVSVTSDGAGYPVVQARPELTNIKLIRARFESPSQQPTEQSRTSRKNWRDEKKNVKMIALKDVRRYVVTPARIINDFFSVRFSDDLTDYVAENTRPVELDMSAEETSSPIQTRSFVNSDAVFDEEPQHQPASATDQLPETEMELTNEADAFKFRPIDPICDTDDIETPQEREPVRKITPTRPEPVFSAGLPHQSASVVHTNANFGNDDYRQQIAAVVDDTTSSYAQNGYAGDENGDTISHSERSKSKDLPDLTQDYATALRGSSWFTADNELPEIGFTRSLRQLWETREPNVSRSTLARAQVTSTRYNATLAAGKTEDKRFYSAVETGDTAQSSQGSEYLGTSELQKKRPQSCSIPAYGQQRQSLAFTKRRLAKFRLLESIYLEQPQRPIRNNKSFKWPVKETSTLQSSSFLLTNAGNPTRQAAISQANQTQPAYDVSSSYSSDVRRDRLQEDVDDSLPTIQDMRTVLERFRSMEDPKLPPPAPVVAFHLPSTPIAKTFGTRVGTRKYNGQSTATSGPIDFKHADGSDEDAIKLNYF